MDRDLVVLACLNYRHDFLLLPLNEQEDIIFKAEGWLDAWEKVLPVGQGIKTKLDDLGMARKLSKEISETISKGLPVKRELVEKLYETGYVEVYD